MAGCRACGHQRLTIIYNRIVALFRLTEAKRDRLFRALADTTRRDIVARVLAGCQASVSALTARCSPSSWTFGCRASVGSMPSSRNPVHVERHWAAYADPRQFER